MKKHSREGVITHKFVEMMKLMNVYLNHFPKHEKQALCAQIRSTAYGLFNLITEGYKRYHKKTTLTPSTRRAWTRWARASAKTPQCISACPRRIKGGSPHDRQGL